MTKFAYISDLHLGFSQCLIKNDNESDCLILAGDIVEIESLGPKSYLDEFFIQCSTQFKTVIWVAGNHEFYGTSFVEGTKKAKKYLQNLGLENVHFLNNETIEVEGIPVHCCTLWTDLKKEDPVVKFQVQRGLNDYAYIKSDTTNRMIITDDTIEENRQSVEFLTGAIRKKCVVVTHHQPDNRGTDSRFLNDPITFGYVNDMSEFILDRPNITNWVAGHTHIVKEYPIGETMVRINCRGYSSRANDAKPRYFDVS